MVVCCLCIDFDSRDITGTHTGHTGHTGRTSGARGQWGKRITRTNLTTIHPNPTTHTRMKTATDLRAARTAASPDESTAPRYTQVKTYRYKSHQT